MLIHTWDRIENAMNDEQAAEVVEDSLFEKTVNAAPSRPILFLADMSHSALYPSSA